MPVSRRTLVAVALPLALIVVSLAAPSGALADDAPLPHRGPWPIGSGHNYQPRRDPLHEADVTPGQAETIDRLYGELQKRSDDLLKHGGSTR